MSLRTGSHWAAGAGGVARKALQVIIKDSVYTAVADLTDIQLQAFEGLTLAEKVPTGGRRLTSQVRCDLDCIAARIKLAAVEKAKKGPPMQSFPLPKLK